ncbi:hypothetical protein A2U01_0021568, partial [Trifolium medium]|nr:hypothetical protein [Trifolium medium]
MSFSSLEPLSLRSLLYYCLSPSIDLRFLTSIIDAVQTFQVSKNLKLEDYLDFTLPLLSGLNVSQEVGTGRTLALKNITSKVCSYMKENAGQFDVNFPVLEEHIVHQILHQPSLTNAFSLVKILAAVDSNVTRVSEVNILLLGSSMFDYLQDVQ